MGFLEHLQICLDKVQLESNKVVILLGDLNGNYNVENPSESGDFGSLLYQWMECNNLSQVINEPTRITSTSATLLDLIITNCPGYFVNSGTLSPPANCDHSFIFAKMSIFLSKQKCYKRSVWNYQNINEEALNLALSNFELDESLVSNNVNILYNNWFLTFQQIVEKHIHRKTVVIRPHDKPWMNSKVRKAIRKRNRLLKNHSRLKTSASWEKYRVQRNYTTTLIRSNKALYYVNLNNKLQEPEVSSKKWWGIVKSLYGQKMRETVPTLMEGPNIISDAKEKAEVLNDYFCSQSTIDDGAATIPNDIISFQSSVILSNVIATEYEINSLLRGVDISKACGPDGISNRIIKICADGITSAFTYLVNLSLSSGVFPEQWKAANVIPLFKTKVDRESKLNYRPISLLDSLSKIIERVVFTRLYNFLLDIKFLNPLQSGYRPGDSTVNQLVYLVHKIHQAFEQGKEVRMVFIDISKAFDRVWHKGLLHKLKLIGVEGPLLSWFESYLSNRKQRVVIDGQYSQWKNINAGVPQGSVLGPLLFLIYINDITENLESYSLLYADDTSLYDIVDNPDTSSTKLNNDLIEIEKWAKRWLATINTKKTKCMTFSVKRLKPPHPDLYFANEKICEVLQHTHLGVKLTANLSWKAHIVNIFENANKKLNMLKGLKFKVSRDTLGKLYKSLIRPVMEYADVLWDNGIASDCDLLEHVQYEAAKIVTGAIKGTSKHRLMQEVGWESMSTRRKIHKLILYYKIVNNLSPTYLKELLPLQVSERTNYSLRTVSDFSLFDSHTERHKASFFPSAARLWNSINIETRSLVSLDFFKNALVTFFDLPVPNVIYNLSNDRFSSVYHTRLRLGACALNSYLFKIRCKVSPVCMCGFNTETIKHYFLHCPIFAAQRQKLLSSAAQLFADDWSRVNDVQIVEMFLHGSSSLSLESNRELFSLVQSYINETKRFHLHDS